jgi:hypothetical protein
MERPFDELVDDILKTIPYIDETYDLMSLKEFQERWNKTEDAARVKSNPRIDAQMYCFFLWCNYRCKVVIDTEREHADERVEKAVETYFDETLLREASKFKNLQWVPNPSTH